MWLMSTFYVIYIYALSVQPEITSYTPPNDGGRFWDFCWYAALYAYTSNGPGNPLMALGDVVNANVWSCCWDKVYNKFYK